MDSPDILDLDSDGSFFIAPITSPQPVPTVPLPQRNRADIELIIRLPTLEKHASEIGAEKDSPYWKQLARARWVAEDRLRCTRRLVKDPRDFNHPASYRDHLRRHMDLSNLNMCICAMATFFLIDDDIDSLRYDPSSARYAALEDWARQDQISQRDDQFKKRYFYWRSYSNPPLSWRDFLQSVDKVNTRSAVHVFVGYPETWIEQGELLKGLRNYFKLPKLKAASTQQVPKWYGSDRFEEDG